MRSLGDAVPGGEPGDNPSLRGMAARFFPRPAVSGFRVPAAACATQSVTGACTSSAQQFCRKMGWRTAARQAMETVRGEAYLADVLCSNTGN